MGADSGKRDGLPEELQDAAETKKDRNAGAGAIPAGAKRPDDRRSAGTVRERSDRSQKRQERQEDREIAGEGLNPPWFLPTALTLMVVGLLWTITTYLFSAQYPIPALGNWNVGVGFAGIMIGFLMLTKWK